MSKLFLIDLTIQWGMLKKHCDRNIGPLYHAFIHSWELIEWSDFQGAWLSLDISYTLQIEGGVVTSTSKGFRWSWDHCGGHGWWGGDTTMCS
jgi:hypothetical protein